MRVLEVVIDGFKSYAVRTVISGWDDSFNSITGLNGSGKSNILDAICFVLGITNMSTVRAQNLQDLIYKRGQAGVTKASVTILFDNREKRKSPIGFEDYAQISVTRQIVLGGTSKYLINGHRAQQHTVQNLFQSVQLNINNPNFLIMQGRITKVLNMKAVEILAMIEEAAGTRMFEDRRDKAIKTMAKKEMKVQEINELLQDEIDPKLDKLRQEKRAFLEFQQTQNDLERLTRLVVAYDYCRTGDRLQISHDELESKRRRATALDDSAVRLKGEISCLNEDVEKVKAARDKELRKGGKFQALEEEVKTHSHELVRLTTVADLKQTSLREEQVKQKSIEASLKDLESQLTSKTKILEQVQTKYDAARSQVSQHTEEVERMEELLQSLQTGVASKEGKEGGFQGQLQEARGQVSATATQQEQARLKLAHLQSTLKEQEPRAEQAKKQNSTLYKQLESLRSQATTLERRLNECGNMEGKEECLIHEELQLTQQIQQLHQQTDSLKRKISSIEFSYNDPTPNFDRSKVKGLVAQLFTLDKSQARTATALEICAGGRLYNVVVDTSHTGTQLLQGGKLKKRVTIIPLDKIAAFRTSAETIGAAQKIAPEKVDLALSLIGYEDEVSAAMEYVFGSIFVCDDPDTAKKVTFDPAVRTKSVTLEGDVYDPAGTLSGGSSAQSSGILLTLQTINELTKQISNLEKQLKTIKHTLAQEKAQIDLARKLRQGLDLKRHEIKLGEEQISNNSSSAIIQAVEDAKANIAQLQREISDAAKAQANAAKEVRKIEKDMKEFDTDKDSKLSELQSTLEKTRKEHFKENQSIKPLQHQMREAKLDVEQCESDLNTAQEQLQDNRVALEAQKVDIEGLVKSQTVVKEKFGIAQATLDDERARLSGFDQELQALEEASQSKAAQIIEESLEMQKLGHAIDKCEKEQTSATQILAQMAKEHEWIAGEKEVFGRAGTAYDFKRQNMADCRAQLKSLSERSQGMRKKINPRVMNMIDSVEKKEMSLKNMMRTVIKDKSKIEETIVSLDEYKKEALHKTWEKVNADFGQIFNELLPGSFAKLDPPEGKTIADGLEVKVCLGKVWKQSLAELSGGQRSLIAISLIMALLQFKPAPMYILDEVDAALDLSHTQNIGRLIKTRFKGSQFIVVSLKDGMFQNANRIFRTRFSDGTSVVQALTPADMK